METGAGGPIYETDIDFHKDPPPLGGGGRDGGSKKYSILLLLIYIFSLILFVLFAPHQPLYLVVLLQIKSFFCYSCI